jgi:hypothetical protein
MFEDIQRRNAPRSVVPWIVGGLALLVGIYFVVNVVVTRSRSGESSESLISLAPASRQLADDAILTRIALPGMSIELPSDPSVDGDYTAGTATTATVTVGWMPGNFIDDPAFNQERFKSFGAGTEPPQRTRFGGALALQDHAGGTNETHTLFGNCGQRDVILHAQASRTAFERIRDSFRCSPDRKLTHLGVIVAPRDGWSRKDDNPKIQLVDRTRAVSITLLSKNEPQNMVRSPGIGIAGSDPEVRGNYRIWRGRGKALDGAPRTAAVVEWSCSGPPYIGGALIAGSGSIDAAIEVALTGSCISMDAPLPAHLRPPSAAPSTP